MSTASRGPKRFSPTTIILILVLLGAVAGASRLVTPPPPGPPAQAGQSPAASQGKSPDIEMMKAKEAETNKQQMAAHKNAAAHIPPVEDPHAADITNNYFIHHKPGEQGLKQVDQELKIQTEKYEAYRRKTAGPPDKTGFKKTLISPKDLPVAVPAR